MVRGRVERLVEMGMEALCPNVVRVFPRIASSEEITSRGGLAKIRLVHNYCIVNNLRSGVDRHCVKGNPLWCGKLIATLSMQFRTFLVYF